MKRDKMEVEELMNIEIKRLQSIQEQQEREGKIPDPLPDEQKLKQQVEKMKARTINQWRDEKFDDFTRKFQKHSTMSTDQIDKKAEEFIQGNNSVLAKATRRRVARVFFNTSRINNSYTNNLKSLPTLSRFIGVVSQYFPELGNELINSLQNEFIEMQGERG